MRRILCVGCDYPGDQFEYVPFGSDQSLLDADIVLYEVGFGDYYAGEEYQGEGLFSHSDSVHVVQHLQHWRSELSAAVKAGKLVIVFLAKPLSRYRYTGEETFSGTGRSRVRTNMVTRVDSYEAVPHGISVKAKSGREVRLTKDGAYLAPYWKEFAEDSPYQAFIDGEFGHVLLETKSGNKTVGAAATGRGTLLLLPPLDYDVDELTTEEDEWTAEALRFGKRLAATLAALYDALLAGRSATPPPPWALASGYETAEEGALRSEIASVSKRITAQQKKRTILEEKLSEAGAIRALLYEQGRPLERAVRDALATLGFSVQSYAADDSEFDVVFESGEGRYLGEVEGKDNRAINIDKFSQLERNLQEDFARDEVDEYAKGVLFGNAERLKPPAERGAAFTAKCISAAKRVGAALVRTSDLFEPATYLRSNADPVYAQACREAIRSAEGSVVMFPPVPIGTKSTTQEKREPAAPSPEMA